MTGLAGVKAVVQEGMCECTVSTGAVVGACESRKLVVGMGAAVKSCGGQVLRRDARWSLHMHAETR